MQKIAHSEKDITNMLKIINVLGGRERELKYLESEWDKGKSAQDACMLRACVLGHTEIVKQIVNKGYDPNTILIDKTGETALHIAIKNGHINVVKALKAANADSDKQDKAGNTPINLAANNSDIKKILQAPEEPKLTQAEKLRYNQTLNLVKQSLSMIDVLNNYKKTPVHKKAFFSSFLKDTTIRNFQITELQTVIKTAASVLEDKNVTPKQADEALNQIKEKIRDLAKRKYDSRFDKVLFDLNTQVNIMKEAAALKIPEAEKASPVIKIK